MASFAGRVTEYLVKPLLSLNSDFPHLKQPLSGMLQVVLLPNPARINSGHAISCHPRCSFSRRIKKEVDISVINHRKRAYESKSEHAFYECNCILKTLSEQWILKLN
jgi:hypothetical protein